MIRIVNGRVATQQCGFALKVRAPFCGKQETLTSAVVCKSSRRFKHVIAFISRPEKSFMCRAGTGRSEVVVQAAASESLLDKVAEIGTMMFPVWALISATTAFFYPSTLNWMTTGQFEQGVGLLMLSMGLSIKLDDFRQCLRQPVPILLGFICQYSILPVLAFTISRVMSLPAAFATGMIVLGSCPGGQASNVATFVAHGNVSLSVLMTTVSTVAAAVMTPLLSTILAGQYIPVNGWALAESTAKLVLVPTIAGVLLNELFPRAVDVVRPVMPLVALFLTVVLCAVPVAQVQATLAQSGAAVVGPVVLLHGFGYFLGYMLPRLLKFSERTSRTVSIETGMQSAAMAYALSTKHFADILVAVPASVSIVIMVWMGAGLAAFWRTKPISDDRP